MSCMRYLTRSRASLVTRRYLHQPSIAHIYQSDDADAKAKRKNASPSLLRTSSFLPQTRFQNSSKIGLFRSDFAVSPRFGASFCRSMSTANGDSGLSDIADLVSENAVEAVASSAPAAVVNEVAVAAADSFYPEYLAQQFIDAVTSFYSVSLVQHFIDAIHSYTGFNWWSSIVIAGLLCRGVIVLPLQLQFRYADFLVRRDNIVRLEELRQKGVWKAKNWVERAKNMKEAFTLVWHPSLALTGLTMIHLFFALGILNMAEKVPSFKTGGAFWFLDLSTPDQRLIFPVLVALLIQLRLTVCIQEWEVNPTILALMSMPFTMCLPTAHLLYLSAYLILHFPARELERYLVKKVAGRISS